MARIFFAAHPTVGHTNALRSIGRRLIAAGHPVAMATTALRVPALPFVPEIARVAAGLPDALRAERIEHVPLPTSAAMIWYATRIPFATGYDELEHALGLFTSSLAEHSRIIAREARRFRADVVVGDYLCFASFLGAQLAGLPFVAFFHSALPFLSARHPPFGSGLPNDAPMDARWSAALQRLEALSNRTDARIARASRALGLAAPAPQLLNRPYSPHLNLLATTEALEPGLPPLEGPVRFTGPCIDARPDEHADDPALRALRDGVRHVYVSLGTVFNGQPRVFGTILRGLERDGVQVVVSAGASFERLRRDPPSRNAVIFARVPQLAVLQRVDAVVTHGGNNTTQETLAAGRPMLVIPFGGDQLENARRVERLGVGVSLLPSQLTEQAVRSACARLLEDRTLVGRASVVAAGLAGADGTARAVEAILGLVQG
ncbi:MAG: glycosyltransferase [Deltaproteobacteria bacterium]